MVNTKLLLGSIQPPQDPFLPQETPTGPSFLDTEACLCALQKTPEADSDNAVWQCIGNQTDGVYTTRSGKWFGTLSGNDVDLPIYDDSNGPNTRKPLAWDEEEKSFKGLDENNDLGVYNNACSGKNRTVFSTAFYRAADELENDKTPVDAAPCWRPGAIPIQIQDVKSWKSNGCSEGFHCANNTVNSLPQYCPPLTLCQEARVAGKVCSFEGANLGMGPFEPVVCQRGWYCPTASQTMRCPAGSYCQPGAATPTPCTVGSICPEGSARQIFMIPLIVFIIIDILLVLGTFLLRLRSRLHSSSLSHIQNAALSKHKGVSGMKATITGYKALPDETENEFDREMMPMNATYMPGRDGWTGFEAALDMNAAFAMGTEEADAELPPQLKVFVESMRKATDVTDFGLSFGYSKLSFHPKGSARPILQDVTGSIKKGSLHAVMGGSGGGKSTFINVLMGKTSHTGGVVTVNNTPDKIKRYKKLIGYVPQDDIVLPELTVYENIVHSARVRLPRTWSDADIDAHVESVIDCLELSHVRDSLVGTVGKPVISGGQRKRVSIGMELAAAPMAIFLDEPTSGLDATAASSIMRTLKALARLGISVIVIIHQPRMEIFDMLDNLILLANGQTIYEGPQSDVHRFFEEVGFHFPEHSNHGDVITDIITGNGRLYKRSGDVSKEALISHWANCQRGEAEEEASAPIAAANSSPSRALRNRGAPRLKQSWLCLRRAMLQQYRAKGAFWAEMVLAALAGFLLGLAESPKKGILFRGLYNEPYGVLSIATDLQSAPELSLLVAIAIGLVSGAPGVKVFSEEMLLHRREAEAGHSRLAYFLAKMISVIPRMVLGCLHFTTPLFLLASPIIPWGLAFLTNLLYFYCIYGLASVVSMIIRREDAPLFATMISLVVGILSGAAPPLSQVQKWHMEWLWRASPGVWLAEVYFGQLVSPLAYLYDVELASEATGFHLNWLWRNILVLLSIGTIYRLFAYAGIMLGGRLRR